MSPHFCCSQRLILKAILLSAIYFFSASLSAQTISYPVAAQNLTRGYSQSALTVKVSFTATCSGTTVAVSLPTSVTYIPGSVTKTSGTGVNIAIAENNISNLGAPVFSLSGITGPGEITFTILRQAECGLGANGKDTVRVNGSCGIAVEKDDNTNTYNIFAPSLRITPPAALTNTVVGTTATRTTIVANGGNGCTDTVRFYIVYPSGGIINNNSNKITVSGTDFTPWRTSGDTLFYKIFGATIFGGDDVLCNGENISILEPVKVIKCNTNTAYGAYWGKTDLPICQIAVSTSAITMATGVPNVIVFNQKLIQASNLCDSAIIEVTFKNTGTETIAGAGTALNISEIIGIHGGEAINIRQDLSVTNITIANGAGVWVPLTQTGGMPTGLGTTTVAASVDLSQLGGTATSTGLVNGNADGIYNDLPVGATFTLRYKVGYVCRSGCATGNHSGAPFYKTNLQDMCGNAVTNTQLAGSTGTPSNSLGFTNRVTGTGATATIPSDIVDGQTITMRITGQRDFLLNNPANSAIACATNQLVLKIVVPKGISMAAGRFYQNSSTGTPGGMISATTISGSTSDTLVIIGQKTNNYNTWAYEADLTLNCAAYVPGAFSYTITYICDNSCGCREVWYCGNLPLTVHCPGCSIGGLTPLSSSMKRTTGGYVNASSASFVNANTLSNAQLKYVMPGDTVVATITGKLFSGTGAPFNKQYYRMVYTAPGNNRVFDPKSAVLKIYTAGVLVGTYTIAAPDSNAIVAGRHRIRYNLSTYGIAINDSIVLEPSFTVLVNNSLSSVPTALSNLKVEMYATNAVNPAIEYTCDAFSAEIYPYRSVGSVSAGTGSITNTGCNNYVYNTGYMLTTAPAVDIYPGEVRNIVLLDSIKVQILNGDEFNSTATMRSLATAAEGSVATVNLDSMRTSADGKTRVYFNPGNWLKAEPSSSGQLYTFSYGFRNNCQSDPTGNIRATYYYKNYGYTQDASFRSPASPFVDKAVINSIPYITLQNNTGVVQGVQSQHYWDVQIANPSSFTTPYIWLALEKGTGTGDITIDSVVAKPSNTLLTSEGTYSATGVTGYSWYKYSAAGIASGGTANFRIYFKYASCNADSILLKAGWNCTAYPGPDPGAYTCVAKQTYLKVEPQPSQVQLSILRQPGAGSTINLCTADSVMVMVNSAQSAYLIDPYVHVYAPQGISIQLPIQVEYPLGSGVYQNATTTPITGGYKIDLTSHSGIGASGLPGTFSSPATAARQAKIILNYTSDCSLTSGTPFRFAAYGNRPCGEPAIGNDVFVNTAGVNITGAIAVGTMVIDISTSSTTLNCGSTTTVTTSITPIGSDTQPGDTVTYTLPAGLNYAGNFSGCAGCTVITATGNDGSALVKVALDPYQPSGTAFTYTFDAVASEIGCANAVKISASAKRFIPPLACGALFCAGSTIVTGSASTLEVTVNKPSLVSSQISFNETVGTGGNSTIDYSTDIINTGTVNAAAGTYLVKIYCGTDNSGTVLHSFYAGAVNAGDTITETGSFTVNVPTQCLQGSPLFVKIQDTTLPGAKSCFCESPAGATSLRALPVKLESFGSTYTGCNVSLKWKTSFEENLSHFTIQYSEDGINFVTAAIQQSKKMVTGSYYDYTFGTLSSASGYFRLMMVDANGQITFSKIISVQNTCTAVGIKVYPNPLKNETYVSLIGKSKVNKYELQDMSGKILQKGILTKTTGNLLKLDQVASGTYLLKVWMDDKLQSKLIQVIR